MKIKLFLLLVIILSQSCGIVHRNKVYEEFTTHLPKSIVVFIDYKSILERSSQIEQFSAISLFPDTIDKGSSLAYKKNSKEGNFIPESQIFEIFDSVLEDKGYVLADRSSFITKPDTISNIINAFKVDSKQYFDAILFIDYSDMFNSYFAGKGVGNNPGHAIYYKYALFDMNSGTILIRYSEVLHPGFYYKSDYSEEELNKEITQLMLKDLDKNFPDSKSNKNP